jgi:adenylylsulfate kinase
VDCEGAFGVWLTGLPASGKSTIAGALKRALEAKNVNCAVLESDALRRVLTPRPRYDDLERETFYRQVVHIGTLLIRHGIAAIFDATANRRGYRDRAREEIAKFLEVYVDTPLEVCMSRDPKGIYRAAGDGAAASVPGLQAAYEPPLCPEIVIHGDSEDPDKSAQRIIARLAEKGYLA